MKTPNIEKEEIEYSEIESNMYKLLEKFTNNIRYLLKEKNKLNVEEILLITSSKVLSTLILSSISYKGHKNNQEEGINTVKKYIENLTKKEIDIDIITDLINLIKEDFKEIDRPIILEYINKNILKIIDEDIEYIFNKNKINGLYKRFINSLNKNPDKNLDKNSFNILLYTKNNTDLYIYKIEKGDDNTGILDCNLDNSKIPENNDKEGVAFKEYIKEVDFFYNLYKRLVDILKKHSICDKKHILIKNYKVLGLSMISKIEVETASDTEVIRNKVIADNILEKKQKEEKKKKLEEIKAKKLDEKKKKKEEIRIKKIEQEKRKQEDLKQKKLKQEDIKQKRIENKKMEEEFKELFSKID